MAVLRATWCSHVVNRASPRESSDGFRDRHQHVLLDVLHAALVEDQTSDGASHQSGRVDRCEQELQRVRRTARRGPGEPVEHGSQRVPVTAPPRRPPA